MSIKWLGAVLIIAACGGIGFLLARAYRKQEASLHQLSQVLEFMAWELEYRLTPLPDLCRQAAKQSKDALQAIFSLLAQELEGQIAPDVEHCMAAALRKIHDLPLLTENAMMQLGVSLGQYDLPGQLKGLKAVVGYCERELQKMSIHREERLRSYQTLGLCAGVALAILFL